MARNAALVMTRAMGGFVAAKIQGMHPNEPVTEGGKLRPASRTAALMKQLKPAAHLAISGRTMEFDGEGRCVAGC